MLILIYMLSKGAQPMDRSDMMEACSNQIKNAEPEDLQH